MGAQRFLGGIGACALAALCAGFPSTASAQGLTVDGVASSNDASLAPLAVAAGPKIDPDAAYAKLCQPCHGASGKGDGPVARALSTRPANLSDPKVLGRSDEDIAAAIRDGKGAMPGFRKQLAADDISALVLYLRALVEAKASGNAPEEEEKK